MRNHWGFTALYMASDSPDIVSRLLHQNVNIDEICGERGEAALHLAAVVGVKDTVAMLLKAGSDINLLTNHNETALWLSAWKGHTDVVRLLLQLNCKLDVASNGFQMFAWNYTPLEIAIGTGHFEITKMLMKAGCPLRNPLYYEVGQEGPCPDIPWLGIRPEVYVYLDNHEEKHKWVRHLLTTPSTLMDLCRFEIRRHLATADKLKQQIVGLPIPTKIQDTLLYYDL